MPPTIRVIIADDHQLFREGLKLLLEEAPLVTVVGETGRADELSALLDRTPCDLLLLDLQMERSALADIEWLALRVPVVVLTASEVPSDAVASIRNGARAVVYKRFAVDTLTQALQTVSAGDVWLPASLQTHMAAHMRGPSANRLTPREEEVVQCVARGQRNAEVAKNLLISEETVKTHLTKIFRKVGVRDRIELVLYAARAGVATGDREQGVPRTTDQSTTNRG